MINKLDRPRLPLPEPLRGLEIGTFAHTTVVKRLPSIGWSVLAENVFPAKETARLEALLAELPSAGIRMLDDPGAPDEEAWNSYIHPHLGMNWLEVPWFFAETYFYRRILEATGYFQPGAIFGIDPFIVQKRLALEMAGATFQALADLLPGFLEAGAQEGQAREEALYRLMLLNIWGNQADLSVWSAKDERRPNYAGLETQQAHLVLDDSARVIAVLAGLKERVTQVDFILDNAGPELLYDLALTDFLLTLDLAGKVRYHAKAHPTFVSDALIKDVVATVVYLSGQDLAAIRELGERLSGHLRTGRLELSANFFWTSPLPFWELPEQLAAELAQAGLILSKGDVNYRRLLGDRHWPAETPVDQVLNYVPAPLVALRVFKAEVVIGLKPGKAAELARLDPDWQFDSRWGMIQFAPGSRAEARDDRGN